MILMKRSFLISSAAVLSSASFLLALNIDANFSGTTAPGTSLEGLPVGELQWTATPTLQWSDGGVSFDSPKAGVAKVPLDDDWSTLTIKASLWPRTSEGGEQTWLAIGAGNPAEDRTDITWSHGVFVLLNSDGFYECFYSPGDGKLQILSKGRIPDFQREDFNEAELVYRRQKNTLSVILNGELCAEDLTIPATPAEIEARWAGFSGGNQPPNLPGVSEFSVRTSR